MIFDNAIFTEMILPFLLVFIVIFAILQKSQILGEKKEQLDMLVSLVIGLLLIGVPQPRDIIIGIMPWLAVAVAVILVFLILYGFVAGDLSGNNIPDWLKNTFMGLAAVFTIGVVLYVSGLWQILFDWASIEQSGDIWMSIVMIVLVLGAAALAVGSTKKKNNSGD